MQITERPKIRAVSFDAAGTLIHLAEEVGVSYARVAGRYGIAADPVALNTAFRTVWKRTPPPFSEDRHTTDPRERDWWGRLVREVFHEAGSPVYGNELFDEFFDTLYRHFEEPGTWLPLPDAKDVVEAVARRHRCVVLSNFDARLRRILADIDLLAPFEAFFLSCENRLSKPDPRLFARVSNALDIPPQEILHVGDDPLCDWAGAAAAGFQHFRVGTGQQNISDLLIELSLA
ncbi:MAG TPA: HAD-IA family hydrolase [Verrucomicrobiales bacterium]|nr:HAD-IA family hydrolase [Verrucomicrobiales bacterium]